MNYGALDGATNPIAAESTGNAGLTNSGGKFKSTWATPNTPGCYIVAIAIVDGSIIVTNFQLG